MDCARFEDLLFEGLDKALGAVDRERMQAHVDTCARCGNLATLMSTGVETAAPEVPVDLLANVLEQTSGSPCGRAQLLLAEGVDAALGEAGGLLSLHLSGCSECAAMGRALATLRQELPALAALDPGDAFVAQVMAATVGSMPTVGSVAPARRSLRRRIEEMWQRIAPRPRLAFEGAYAAIVVVFLIFGLPTRSVADLPARAFEGVRQETIKVQSAMTTGLDEFAEMGRATWAESSDRAVAYFAATTSATGDASRLEVTLRSWAQVTFDVVDDVWNALFVPLVEQIQSLWQSTPATNVTLNPETDSNR